MKTLVSEKSSNTISTITIRPKSTRGAIRKADFTQAKPKSTKCDLQAARTWNNPPEEHQRCDSQGGFYASEAKKSESAICKQRERENLTLTGNSRGSFFMEKIQVLSADVQACLKNSEKGVDKGSGVW